jgi:hypothetical protein
MRYFLFVQQDNHKTYLGSVMSTREAVYQWAASLGMRCRIQQRGRVVLY